jgi:branched-chain amino acid aminotransferase
VIIWADGQLCEEDDLRLGAFDRGFTLGDGLFETMVWTGERVARFSAHWARLAGGLAFFKIAMPFSEPSILDGIGALVAASMPAEARCVVKLIVSRGVGARGLAYPREGRPRVVMTTSPFPAALGAASLLSVSIHRNPTAPSARFKTLSYVDNVAALNEARALGGDDALMLSTDGRVACASAANLFFWDGRDWLTPPVKDGAMAGVCRGLALAAGAREHSIAAKDVGRFACAALTNTVVGVRPLAAIDGAPLDADHSALETLRAMIMDSPSR